MGQIQKSIDDVGYSVEEVLKIYRDLAKTIDPSTAEVEWYMIVSGDPYGLFPIPGDACAERGFFARNPGDEIWVSFDDLPKPVAKVLIEKNRSKLFLTVPEHFARILYESGRS